MKNFITNSQAKNLKQRLVELIAKSEELKFLVGFFYFSGIRELFEGLRNNPKVKIKVLVGLDVDKHNAALVEVAESNSELTDEERARQFLRSVKKSLNSDDFDNQEFYEQVKYFIKLILEDRLVIRKTYEPNHAKIYLFKLEEGQVGKRELFITGSSNLTKAGLATQNEFNVEIADYGFLEAENYFDALWAEAVMITEDDKLKQELVQIIEKETLVKEITPFAAFVLVLRHYLDFFSGKKIGQSLVELLRRRGYTPYKYQLDAVSQALAIIENNNGVIIADVVGLGKTIIACLVAKELRKRGLVICPPGLIGDRNKNSGWRRYTEEFGLYDWEIRSAGDLKKVAEFVRQTEDIEVVIIDEAHRFRNQDTKDYEYLHNICRGKIVILLTATPFNNKPADILSLLKLFIIPKKSPITLENNLVDKFKIFKSTFEKLAYISKYYNSANQNKRKRALNYYERLFGDKNIDLGNIKRRTQYLAKQIRDVIEPVTIRRNRLDLQNNPFYKNEVKHLSKIEDPLEWFYELDKEQSDFYDRIIRDYFGDPELAGRFKGAIYRPFEYEVEKKKIEEEKLSATENFQFIQQRNLYDFMRRLMVKRFESSFGAFQQSIKNFKKVTGNALKFIEKTGEYILDRSLLEKIYNLDSEKIEQALQEYTTKISNGEYPKNHKRYKLENFKYKSQFIADIKADLKLFDQILAELAKLNLVKNDPKVDCLVKNIHKAINRPPSKGEPKRKAVIFSEYLDTVKYLEPILQKEFSGRVLVVKGDLSTAKVLEINKNFDADYNEQEDKYDILLATDKISEGFNLNRAGIVINYDIPWNPVRVIQRVGRINRISRKVFAKLYIVNFFPTEKGAELVRSREIAGNKMFLIHNTLGEDAKIFDPDEEPTPASLYHKIQQNPDQQEEESFYTKALRYYQQIEQRFPALVKDIKNYPTRIKTAKKAEENELLVFFKKKRLYVYGIKYDQEKDGKVYNISFEDAFNKIICPKDEARLELSNNFWDYYAKIKNYREHKAPASENSLEEKAKNNLRTLLANTWEGLGPYLPFLRILLEDIFEYGTLTDYTLRRIANLEVGQDKEKQKTAEKEIAALKQELGENYLQKIKEKQKNLSKEIIIAIENQV